MPKVVEVRDTLIEVPAELEHLYDDRASRKIKKVPAPVLRLVARPVEKITKRHLLLIETMIEAMHEAHGIGLAAPQIGVSERIVIIAPGGQRPVPVINPEIVHAEGEIVGEEGCLSIPGLYGDVKRASLVRLKGLDRKGRPVLYELKNLSARIAQHELDHLDGRLFTDWVDMETLHWRDPNALPEDADGDDPEEGAA